MYRHKTILQSLIVAATFLLGGGRVFADEISLEEALAAFYQSNYDVLISRFEIDKAQADYIGAQLLSNPSLSFNYTFIGLQGFPKVTDNTQTVTRIDQVIELGGKRGLRTDAALESLAASKFTQKDTLRLLLAGFYTLFFNINADVLNADLARDELKRFGRTLEVGEKRFHAGFLSLVDYTKLTLARIELENNLISLEAQLKNDVEQFSVMLGSVVPVRPALQASEEFAEYAEEDLLRISDQYRFDLLSIEKQLKASEISQKLAKAQAVPDITVGAEFETIGPKYSPGVGFGLSLPLPLFNRNQGEVARKSAEYHQLETQRDKIKRQIVADIRQALNNYATSTKVFDAYKRRRKDMEELIARSEKAFSLGGITVIELLDTEKTYRDFMNKYHQALVQGNLNRELLKISTGELR